MKTITDEYMLEMRSRTKAYVIVILRAGPRYSEPGADKIIWEHGRRNHALRAEGLLSIVCPVMDGSPVRGIGIFNLAVEEVDRLMSEDPGVKEGIFVYEAHSCRSFPGDALPA